MAEQGAHVTSAVGGEGKPSIFEVLAQESLMSAVRPALRHAVRVLGETKPAQFGWLYRYYEEAYTVLDLVLQNYFLKNYGGSFSENFYGLKRVSMSRDTSSSDPHLSSSQHWRSLLTLVFLPYLKQKMDHKFEELRNIQGSVFSQQQVSVLL
ncbi:peroxisome assembly protein 12-A-like [Liolophura sinensis]|uniref:peroxisome assembly protein 12-A-like n=1 Tax=Liolophura sinensis TaxID=3198878 RepID=UPI0031582FDE